MVRPAQPMRRNASKRKGWSSGRTQRREDGGATRRSSGQMPVYATRIRHGVVGGDARDRRHGPMSAHPERLGAKVNRELRDRLVADGEAALRAPRGVVHFTGDAEADALLNDLAGVPQAFVFACLVDRQITAERAWMVPTLILRRFGSLDMSKLESLTEQQWVALMREPTPAHRSPETMALVLFRATRRIVDHYGGDASKIWNGKPAAPPLSAASWSFTVRDRRSRRWRPTSSSAIFTSRLPTIATSISLRTRRSNASWHGWVSSKTVLVRTSLSMPRAN